MDYRKYTLNEEHRRMFQLMGLNENIISEQDEKEKIKDLKDAIKRERKSKRQEKRADRKKARQQKRVLKKFEQLCSKYPDSPECADKDKFISDTEEEIKKVEVDTQDVADDVADDVAGDQETKEKICNLKDSDPWEYKVENEEWYTRKKGTEKWKSLAADNMKKARCILDKKCKGYRTKTEQNCEATKQNKDTKQGKATLQEGCSEKAVKTFHKNMMTEVNGTGSAGGTAEGFAGVVKNLTQYHKYYCKCMNENNYKALDLEVNDKVLEFQKVWKSTINC